VAGRRKVPARSRKATARPTRLSGGNPQILKGYGEAPVRAYLSALPGWKKPLGRKLDALITRAVPDVSKAVKYNSPMYGMDGRTWFLSFHCFDEYLKVSFFRGTQLDPVPPVASKLPRVRYFHLRETDVLDETGFTTWVKQASSLPGEKL
jgi:hypothetical protein